MGTMQDTMTDKVIEAIIGADPEVFDWYAFSGPMTDDWAWDRHPADPTVPFWVVTMIDPDADEDDGEVLVGHKVLSVADFHAAVEACYLDSPEGSYLIEWFEQAGYRGAGEWSDTDDIDMDVFLADAILQHAVLGELVYG
jgi:hypothetical protein